MTLGGPPGTRSPDNAPRPWERPGAGRRNALPHRGPLLDGLATIAIIFFVLPPVALLLGTLVWLETGQDLGLMEAGLMDPAGKAHTRQASMAALAATLIGACLMAGVGALLLADLFGL